MSDLLGIGASAINAYSAALGAVGENVANAQTEGYARRSVSLQSQGVGANGVLYSTSQAFSGVQVAGVTRAWDSFRASDALSATADDGRAAATATWLDAAGDALGDGDSGLGAQLTAVFTAGSTLASDPTSTTNRTQLLSAIGSAAQGISGAAGQLAKVSTGIGDAARDATAAANVSLQALAKVNATIARTADGTDAKATLADQRDQLLSDLAGKLGIQSTINADGTATVGLAGSANVTLLSGGTAAIVALTRADDGRLALTAGLGTNVATIQPTGGSLAGLRDAADGVAGQRDGLDTLAANLATQLNAWNARGTTAAGTAGAALLTTTGGAAGLKLATADPAAIAAAGSDGSANGNLLALSDLRGSTGVEQQMSTLVSSGAQALASAKAQASAASTRKSAALTAQADVNGVSLDQQAADLVRYQQAYQGSAKIIQAAQTTMNAILALF